MDENKILPSKFVEKLSVDNKHILSEFENIFLDCDGVIWRGNTILNKANDVIKKLQDSGKNIFLVTNSSVITQEEFLKKCMSHGISLNKECAFAVPTVIAQYLKNINFKKKIYVVGSQELVKELQSWGFCCVGSLEEEEEKVDVSHLYAAVQKGELFLDADVGAVVVALDLAFNYRKILTATCYLKNPDCIFLGSHVDIKYAIENTNYYFPIDGVVVRAMEAAAGRDATIIGKPSTFIFDILSSKFDLKPEKCLMVGDTMKTDIVFGNNCGMKTLLVLTGVTSLEDVEKVEREKERMNKNMIPHYYIESLGDLYDLI